MGRALDLALGLPLFVLACPVIALAAVCVRLGSAGPGLFSQSRVGRGGKTFRCHKIRTMHVGTGTLPTHQVDAAAITPLGRLLRASKIDELPQLWNVLAGEMSLVGPRPCLPVQDELIAWRSRLGVDALRPGITGLAQIRGIDMSDPRACAEADAEYLRERSAGLDLRILARTLARR